MGISVDPTQTFPSHPSEEILEEYVFHRLPEALAAQVEEHLLICHACQDTVAGTDRFVSAFKVASKQPATPGGQVGLACRKFLDALPRFASARASLVPVVALSILALLMVLKHPQAPGAPIAVSLSSLRGPNPLSPAPAGKPLQLNIEAPDLMPGKQYRVVVADAAGGQVWKGAVTETDGKLAVHVPRELASGAYWVRLYSADSELLREYGLSVK